MMKKSKQPPLRNSVSSVVLFAFATSVIAAEVEPLPGTKPLTMEGDIASQLVEGVDKFLLRKIDESVAKRERHWKRDFSSAEAYNKSIEPNRKRLAKILGVVEPRVPFGAPELIATTKQGALVGKGENYEIYAIRWPVLEDPDPSRSDVTVYGEGLLCVPSGGKKPIADVIAIPDADQTPEQFLGLAQGMPLEQQFARQIASCGCRVVVPVVISREIKPRHGRVALTNREYLYRSSFEIGRHIIGYEVQKVLACVDWFTRDAGRNGAKIGIAGYGEGGLIAFYAAAIDERVDGVFTSGYFDRREGIARIAKRPDTGQPYTRDDGIWMQPLDRNVFGLLDQFGDAETLSLVMPRSIVVEVGNGPRLKIPGNGGAPSQLEPTDSITAQDEMGRFGRIVEPLRRPPLNKSVDINITFLKPKELPSRRRSIPAEHQRPESERRPQPEWRPKTAAVRHVADIVDDRRVEEPEIKSPEVTGVLPNSAARQARQLAEIDRHTQLVLRESPFVRQQFMKKLYDAANKKDLAAYEKVADEYREIFRNEVIGAFDDPLLPANPRSRKAYDKEKWKGYEVVLDVWPDVIAYGLLLVPKDLKPGEKRPVVVCQHGLEGRPQHLVEGDHAAYHDYAAKLAERGFITFAPQNLYIFQDRFRTLQRKANPLGKTLFSIIVPQHQQITDWLKTLPFVDGQRIGFYGLSYGGKSAMRIPPLVKNYCLSICSADFNEWVDKNASTRNPHSYVWSGEYEIFEWDLGSTFNYAEMAALIAPRPFMVERGHFDGVASDETVAHEFAKVRYHYAARLGIGDRCEIEWFVGPHTINGKGTFDFLHKHLKWPKPDERSP
jgi:dienelactone hydrolase